MSNSCPVLTPAERQINDIIDRAGAEMMAKVFDALDTATKQVAEEWKAVQTDGQTTGQTDGQTGENPPPYDYFASVVHQRMFLALCGADAKAMTGGDAALAGHLIRNQQNIVEHYGWVAKDRDD